MPFDQLRRREFISLAGSAALAWPLHARAQKSTRKPYRIGVLSGGPVSEYKRYKRFVAEMKSLGYSEGQDYVVERRFANFRYERLPELAVELVRLNVDVIVATTRLAVRAAQQTTSNIPIVMYVSADPVGMGLVASLARPGGNTTGLSSANDETYPKQLELLASVVPYLTRVAFLVNPTDAGLPSQSVLDNLEDAAQKIGITIQRLEVRNPTDIVGSFAAMKEERAQALMMNSAPLLNSLRSRVSRLALTHKLPSISQTREYAELGGLMSYGESGDEIARRIAYFVDKILKGAKPADLPIELPTHFSLVLNRKTANALGLTIPASLLVAATDIIE